MGSTSPGNPPPKTFNGKARILKIRHTQQKYGEKGDKFAYLSVSNFL